MAVDTPERAASRSTADAITLGLGAAAFASLGLRDGLLGVVWPSVQSVFGLPVDGLGVLLLAATAGYVLATSASGNLSGRLTIRAVVGTGAAVMGLALVGAALAPAWAWLVACTAAAAMGAGVIDASFNAYLARNTGARVLSWAHAAWGIGSLGSPALFTALLSVGLGWRWEYGVIGIAIGAIALACLAARGQRQPSQATSAPVVQASFSLVQTVRQPAVWVRVSLFVLYIGVEATAGTWLFTVLTESRGVAPTVAGVWVSGYWASLTAGRLLFGAAARPSSVQRMLRLSLLGVVLGAAVLWFPGPAWLSLAGTLILGLALAPVFPVLVAETDTQVGPEHTANAMGVQFAAAAIGGALIPAAAGLLAARAGLEAVLTLQLTVAVMLLAAHTLVVRQSAAR